MVMVFQLICEEQHIIISSLQIKELLLLNTIMGFVWRMVMVFQLICEEQHIILNSLQIKDLLLLNLVMEFV
jgi:hypothetical protein